jgi:hypothetical protein
VSDPADALLDTAIERMRQDMAREPRAVAATYDAASGRISVDLANGCMFAFPPRLALGLEQASAEQLAAVQIEQFGFRLSWPTLRVTVSLPDLMAARFGTTTHLARRAGQATSPAKASAARANGSKGGRPRRPTA